MRFAAAIASDPNQRSGINLNPHLHELAGGSQISLRFVFTAVAAALRRDKNVTMAEAFLSRRKAAPTKD
jgi:hypothetical protein